MQSIIKRPGTTLAVLAVLTSVVATYVLSSPAKEEEALDTGDHAYIAPGPEDVRSPCPALNVLANHGYLPRNGKNITPRKLFPALEKVYGLSKPLAGLLAFGGFFLVHQHPMTSIDDLKPKFRDFQNLEAIAHKIDSLESLFHNVIERRELDLAEIAAHNHIEHDASITHDDIADLHAEFASPTNNLALFEAFLTDSASGTHIDAADIGRARARRERESHNATGRTLDALHSDIARGEAALVVSIFGETATKSGSPWKGPGVPFETVRRFWRDERLPEGWKPKRETTIKGIKEGKALIDQSMAQVAAALGVTRSPSSQDHQVVLSN